MRSPLSRNARHVAYPGRVIACLVFALIACTLSACTSESVVGSDAIDPGASREEGLKGLEKIGVIGASQSAGFGCGISLGKAMRKGVRAPHTLVEFSNTLFYLDAVNVGKQQIETLLPHAPTTTIAVDYLFWYVYGRKPLERRISNLELGFANLEKLDGALLVGNIPDMKGAAQWLLPKAAIPPAEEIAEINKRIEAWAAQRENTRVIPLAEYVAAIKGKQPVTVGSETRTFEVSKVLNGDRLHGTRLGQALLTLLCLHELHALYPGLLEQDLVLGIAAMSDALNPKPVEATSSGSSDSSP